MRNPSVLSVVAPLALSTFAGVATASDADSGEAVVVTATRIPTPEEQIASSMTVITADDIAAAQRQTLPDVLQQVPGLNVVQTGGPGGTTSVFMRGTNANHTKVLVDGIDVSDPSSPSGTFDFGHFLTQDIERIEILRGPQSGLYWSDAIGGVINIITKGGQGPAKVSLNLQAGSFDTFNQYASVSGSADRFHYAANIEHLHSGSTPVTPLDLLPPGQGRNNDYYDNLTYSTKLGFDVTRNFDLGLVARYTDTHLRVTADEFNLNTFSFTPAAEQSANNTRQLYTRLTAHWVSLEGVLDQTVGAAYSDVKSFDFSPDVAVSPFEGKRQKYDWQGIVRVAKEHTLVLGAEHQHDQMNEPISASINIDSGYAELQSDFSGRVFNTLSVRYDGNDRFGGKATWRVAPAWRVNDSGTKLKATVGSGFKAPTLDELFHNYPEFGFFANPNLRPETSVGFDLGVEQSLAHDTVSFGVTYFHNYIRNLISNNADFSSYVNVGRAETQGVESFVAYQPLTNLSLRLDYTYTEATDEILDQELLRRPKNKASLESRWQATRALLVNTTVLYVGPWIDGNRDFSIPRLTAPGYTIVNIAGNYDVNRYLTVFARIDNLFDRSYQNPTGFLRPGLGAYAGIKTRF